MVSTSAFTSWAEHERALEAGIAELEARLLLLAAPGLIIVLTPEEHELVVDVLDAAVHQRESSMMFLGEHSRNVCVRVLRDVLARLRRDV